MSHVFSIYHADNTVRIYPNLDGVCAGERPSQYVRFTPPYTLDDKAKNSIDQPVTWQSKALPKRFVVHNSLV